jgi:hypothetical protein
MPTVVQCVNGSYPHRRLEDISVMGEFIGLDIDHGNLGLHDVTAQLTGLSCIVQPPLPISTYTGEARRTGAEEARHFARKPTRDRRLR